MAKHIGKWLLRNWERCLFALTGLAFIGICFCLIYDEKVTEAAIVFGLGFLCFMYANVARFKRFKGLGFEAELWEKAQEEAESLINQLKKVVAIYTHEIVMSKVTANRYSSNDRWRPIWKLYEELSLQHNEIGQNIDFSDLKKKMDDYFLFDLCQRPKSIILERLSIERSKANNIIDKEFEKPIKDHDAYRKRLQNLEEIEFRSKGDFEISQKGNLAQHWIDQFQGACNKFRDNFGIEPELDNESLDRLKKLADVYRSRPVKITEELLGWSEKA